jgi:hypothetical protein
VEHHKADVRQVAACGSSGDDTARFLRELRQLRDGAGLGQAELAARAHFPYDSIRAAEVGPSLPDLPVLCAYVRGCGGTTEEWEERWRSLTRSPSLPVSASRHAGRSDAATAGARIGSVAQIGDSPDPSIIIAALNRVAEEMAGPGDDEAPSLPDVGPLPVQSTPDVSPIPDLTSLPDLPDLSSPDLPSLPARSSLPDLPSLPTRSSLPDQSSADVSSSTDQTSSDVEPPPDLPSRRAPLPPAAEALPSAPEPKTSDKPAGWDPIRVSTAWPALRDTPAPTGTAGNGSWGRTPPRKRTASANGSGSAKGTGSAKGNGSAKDTASSSSTVPPSGTSSPGSTVSFGGTGSGVPWGTPPWTEGSADATSSAAATRRATAGDDRASMTRSVPADVGHGSGHSMASWTWIAVIAAVLLCVLAVLLAIFT